MKKSILSSLLLASVVLATRAHAEGPDLAAKCRESGDHLTCAAAGAPLEATSPETTFELYSVACAKHPDQCWALVSFAQRSLKKRDAARAAQMFEKGCELRSARACAAFAGELEEGERGIPADVTKAAKFHDKACTLGAARSCMLLAVMVDDGRGTRRDPARAATLRARTESLEKAMPRATASPAEIAADEALCRKSQDAGRCLSAAAVLQDTDAVKAEELFRLGCGIDKATCGLWGFALDRFRKDDASRGTRILEEGCAQNVSLACMLLADLNHAGPKSVTRNEPRAAELYDRACTQGDPSGCRATASRFRGAKVIPKADELRERAWSLEAEADKPIADLQAKWIKEAAGLQARDPYVRELERRRAEWRSLAARSRARWDLRMQRLAAVEAGKEPAPLPPPPPDDAEASAARDVAIKRMSKLLFP